MFPEQGRSMPYLTEGAAAPLCSISLWEILLRPECSHNTGIKRWFFMERLRTWHLLAEEHIPVLTLCLPKQNKKMLFELPSFYSIPYFPRACLFSYSDWQNVKINIFRLKAGTDSYLGRRRDTKGATSSKDLLGTSRKDEEE